MDLSIHDFWPGLLERIKFVHEATVGIAMVLVAVGIIGRAIAGIYGDVSHSLRAVACSAVVAVAIVSFPDWVDQAQLMMHSLVQELGADPSKSHERFALLIAGPETGSAEAPGFWDVMFDDQGGIGKAVLYAIILLMGKIALVVMWIAVTFQKLVLIFSITVSPIFLAMLLLSATRELGVKFVLTIVGIVAWPLGWAIADTVTGALLELAASPETYDSAGGVPALEASQGFFLIVMLSLWLTSTTIAAPYAIYKALQTGGQVGAALLGSVGAALSQSGSYAVGANVTAAMSGASGAGRASATTLAGAAGLMSGAAGTSGMIVPALIGTMAVKASAAPQQNHKQQAEEMAERERSKR